MSSQSQLAALAIVPKITGCFSLVGSAFIFQDIVFHGKPTPAKRVFRRVMLGLSSADAMASVVNILSTWPIPEGTPGVYLASGTVQTCTAQGFFNELGNMATPLYNASLCVYFARIVRDGWSEHEIQIYNERVMHLIPTFVALTISVLGLIFDLYNNSGWLCWFAENPFGCANDPDVECIRGELAEPFRWTHYAIIWSAIFFIGYEMYSIYSFVKAYERSEYAESNDEGRTSTRGTKAKKVAIQAGLFVGALYLTWFFTTLARIYNNITGRNNFMLQLLMAIFFPLQGFFNSLIYIRPRYLRARSRNPTFSMRRLFLIALHHDSHPVHLITTRPSAVNNVVDTRPEFERQLESPTSSDYSIGPRQIDPSTEDGYSSDVVDDGIYSVADTVNARADESEFKNREALKAAAANATSVSKTLDEEADPLKDESNNTINGENAIQDESSKPQEAKDNPNTQ